MYFAISLCVAVLLLSDLSEQTMYDGSCASFNFAAVAPFSPVKVHGKWYLVATDDEGLPYHLFDCIRFKNSATGGLKVSTYERAEHLDTETQASSKSTMQFNGSDGNYIYVEGSIRQPTTIIRSDDNSYIEVSCNDVKGQADIYVGVFLINPEYPTDTEAEVNTFLQSQKIDTTKLRSVKQDNKVCGEWTS